MQWLSWLFGLTDKHEPLLAREEDLPGIGRVRVSYVVDCMGAMCPRPQLLTMKILGQVGAGEVIEVISDNPAAVESFPALAETLFCSHLLTVREVDYWRLYLRKSFST
jgi:tRNA 2-thiouridine synthesizing protein A